MNKELSIVNDPLSIMNEVEYPERDIRLIVIHCSATRCNVPFNPDMLEIAHEQRGFDGIGYHFYIETDGLVHYTRRLHRVGAHAKGFNRNSIGICYEGGLTPDGKPADTRTEAQKIALLDLITALKKVFPKAVVKGHYQLSADIHKACPCFDAEREYELR